MGIAILFGLGPAGWMGKRQLNTGLTLRKRDA